ncbi:MAG: ABC transporter permease [Acidimicrobiia bacterium]
MTVMVQEDQQRPATTGKARVVRRPVGSPVEIRRRSVRARRVDLTLGVVVPLVLLGLWELASRQGWIDRRIYPPVTTVIQTGWELASDGVLGDAAATTLKRLLQGFFLGSILGFVVGMGMGLGHRIRAALEPLLNALYVVPKLALLPIFLTMFGFGDTSKVVLVAVVVFFFVWINTMETFATVPLAYREVAKSFGASRTRTFLQVFLPSSLPQIFVGLRMAMSVSVLSIVGAEFLVGSTGLGYLIFNSRQLFFQDRMYAGIIAVAVMGVILSSIIAFIGRRLTPWAKVERQQLKV